MADDDVIPDEFDETEQANEEEEDEDEAGDDDVNEVSTALERYAEQNLGRRIC